jgi:hypothetical protein
MKSGIPSISRLAIKRSRQSLVPANTLQRKNVLVHPIGKGQRYNAFG